MLTNGFPVQKSMGGERLFLKVLQDHVILVRKVKDQSMLLAVCRDTGDAILKGLLRTLIEYIFSKHGDCTGFCFPKAGQYFYQLGLSITVYTGQTYDLAFSYIQVKAFQDLNTAVVPGMKVFHFQHHFARLHLFLINFEVDITAHHHSCQLILIHICHFHGLDIFTLTDDGTVIRRCCDLLQLMGDQDHALAVSSQVLDDIHKAFDLLRGQGSRRLVQDQCLRTAVQNLQDLHTLLHTNRDILHLRIRIYLHAITFG